MKNKESPPPNGEGFFFAPATPGKVVGAVTCDFQKIIGKVEEKG